MDAPTAEHAPPQGVYGFTAQELEAGEVWAQSFEVVWLSVQGGLGNGFDLTGGIALVPSSGVGLLPSFELGRGWTLGLAGQRLSVRPSVGAVGLLYASDLAGKSEFVFAGSDSFGVGMMAANAGVAAALGTRQQNLTVGVRALWVPGLDGGGALVHVDGVYPLAKHHSVLAGGSVVALATPLRDLNAVAFGASWRGVWGRLSFDAGLQVGGGPELGLCFTEEGIPEACPAWAPVPVLAARWAFGGGTPAP